MPIWPNTCRIKCRAASSNASRYARSLVNDPGLILADEPTGALDTKSSHDVMRLFARLNDEQGITIMCVTHEPDVAAYARRIVMFRDGSIVSDDINDKRAA